MSLVTVVAASPMEAAPVRKLAGSSDRASAFQCGSNEIVLVICGMGPENAARSAGARLAGAPGGAVAPRPDAVLVVGLCGALTPSLPEGRIVTYSECRSTEAPDSVLSCSEGISNSILQCLASSAIQCEGVVGLTSARIAATRNERLVLADSGAAVVDMESFPIIQAAWAAGVPAAVLRVVADSIDRELPDFNRALDDKGGLDGRKALKVALGSPVRTARLLAANRRAMQEMARALEVVLKSPCFA